MRTLIALIMSLVCVCACTLTFAQQNVRMPDGLALTGFEYPIPTRLTEMRRTSGVGISQAILLPLGSPRRSRK